MLTLAIAAAALATAPFSITISVPNQVTVTDANGNNRAPNDTPWGATIDLNPGDVIRSGIISATFTEFYGADITIGPRTQMVYLGPSDDAELQVLSGSFRYVHTPTRGLDPNIFRRIVKTRSRTIGSGGTDFTVTVSNNLNTLKTVTVVAVVEGYAVVAGNPDIRIPAGETKTFEDKIPMVPNTPTASGGYQRTSRRHGRTLGSGGM
ncbi:MAG: FecR domain-containing protein [Armatimonadetes bacterium]|nr:FecR domain-containing protein [Armatimonadota bacterium]MBS1712203.1 FecR domain-containing protein [Armatimonadota bacterium]MBX3107910.1 FecR domain-containing protein [Fimbriimonadaceae bacterium]